jgi:hypothetical protein
MRFAAALTVSLLLAASAHPAPALAAAPKPVQVCAWIDEVGEPDSQHTLKLWLQADGDVVGIYEIAGEGLVGEAVRSHSPASGSLVLHPGKAVSPWSFGATLSPPGRIDVIVRLRAPTASIFDPPGPVMVEYAFRRVVPEDEANSPPVFAERQCKALATSPAGETAP